MDKKLILNVGNIEYKSNKVEKSNSFVELKKNIELLPKVLKFFEKIKIDKLKIGDNEFEIVLNDEIFYLDNKYINIASKIDTISNQVVFELYSLYLKDADVMFDGKIKVDYFNEKLNYYGKVYYQDLQSNINVEMTKKLAKVYLESEHFKNIKFLKNIIDLPAIAESWMYDNVEGDFQIKELYAEYDLENNHIIEDSIQGKAQIKGAKIRFHKDVDVINTKSLDISFKNNKLDLNLIEPTYKDKKLDGSYVSIHNLTSAANGEVDVFINANSKLDKDILDILKAYKINLPLVQKTGTTQASLLMKFPYEDSKDMSIHGDFFVDDAQISINDFTFYSKKAEVVLDDSLIKIKDSDFKYKSMIDSVVNLELNTKTLKSQGEANIKSFLIKEGKDTDILDIKNKKTPITLDFNKEVNISLKDLGTKVKVSDLVYVNIDDLSKIYPYSKLLKDISINEGNINLQIKDENNISFDAFIKGFNFPIQKDDKNINSLDITGKIEKDKVTIISKDENIKIQIADKLNIFLKNIDVILDPKLKESGLERDMNINLTNSRLKIDNDIYHLKNAKIQIENKAIDFEADVKNLDLPIRKNNEKVENLSLIGNIKNNITLIQTKEKDLNLELKKDSLSLHVDGYNLYYSKTDNSNDEIKYKEIDLKGKNSNIILNDKYKFLADNFEIKVRPDSKFISLNHKETNFTFKESKDKKIDIFSNNMNDEFINSIFDKQVFKGGNVLLHASGDMNNLNGKIIITDANISDLAILNNLLLFIQTSPALINPFLAIPSVVGMATNSGFNLLAYKIVNGNIEFNYSKEKALLDIKKFITVGNGIDFDGSGQVNLNTLEINSNIKLIFLKDYSKIVGMIPVLNYVLLGDNNRVETEVNIKGTLDNPEISTNLTKDTISVPMNIGKRILTSPAKLLDYITGDSKEEEKTKENEINKPLK
jgi:hypothetical protein